MQKWVVAALGISLLAILIISRAPSRHPGANESGRLNLEPGLGRVAGVVLDSGDDIPEGSSPQFYEGALIVIHRALEAGTYKTSGEEPEQVNYEVGELVAEIESGELGCWQADLDPGKYFIRAFYGESSYSEELLIDIDAATILDLRLELLHGV